MSEEEAWKELTSSPWEELEGIFREATKQISLSQRTEEHLIQTLIYPYLEENSYSGAKRRPAVYHSEVWEEMQSTQLLKPEEHYASLSKKATDLILQTGVFWVHLCHRYTRRSAWRSFDYVNLGKRLIHQLEVTSGEEWKYEEQTIYGDILSHYEEIIISLRKQPDLRINFGPKTTDDFTSVQIDGGHVYPDRSWDLTGMILDSTIFH